MKYLKTYKITESFNIKGLDLHMKELDNLNNEIQSKNQLILKLEEERDKKSSEVSEKFNMVKMLVSIFNKIKIDINNDNIFAPLLNKDTNLNEFFDSFYINYTDQYDNPNYGQILDIYMSEDEWFISIDNDDSEEIYPYDIKEVSEQYELIKTLMSSPYIQSLINKNLFDKINGQ